jgi:hypothetical protein
MNDSTALHVLAILLTFALAGCGWLGWLLFLKVDDLRITRVELKDARRLSHTRLLTLDVQHRRLQRAHNQLAAHEVALCIMKRERDDALGNLTRVLDDEDVASTLDMKTLVRDTAIVRHGLAAVR